MEDLLNIIKRFPEKRITIIGDVMLDKYVHGNVNKISPEAPIPVINVEKEFYEPGGAANVASNVSSMGGKVSLFGFVGQDPNAEILKKILQEKKIDFYFDNSSKTTLKTRIIARSQQSDQQLIRIDDEETNKKLFSQETLEKIKKSISESDIVIVSDYSKGAITKELMNFIKQGKRIIIGPKQKDISLYSGVFLILPNETEAKYISGREDINESGRFMKIFAENIIITRGKNGMSLFSEKEINIPTYARKVEDVTGAGDTVLSTIALALASQASLEQAAIIANHAAGIVVGKKGTYSVTLHELEKMLTGEDKKLKTIEELEPILADLKRKGKKIVWTNGCFDILHIGHVKYLAEAKEQGDCLIIGLNSDSSVRLLKGPSRPVTNENSRAEIISSLEFVDYVIIFSEPIVEKYLQLFKPDIYVKGGDYNLETMNQQERKAIEEYNGKIIFIPIKENISTTKIIDKLKK